MITWAGVWIQRLGLNKQWSNNCFSRRSLGKTLHKVFNSYARRCCLRFYAITLCLIMVIRSLGKHI